MKKSNSAILLLTTVVLLSTPGLTRGQGTAFTYQGRFTDNGAPYTGNLEIQATLWDAVTGGSQIAANVPAQVLVAVTNGLFVLPLNFGANFPGADRWLKLDVRTSIGAFTPLNPRQPLTPAPYAIAAGNLTGPVASASLAGTYSAPLTLNNAANSFSGSGAGLTALNASQLDSGTVPDARLAVNLARTNQVWLLDGNAGTTTGSHFLGTTDDHSLELRVNGARALRLEPTVNNVSHSNIVNVVGGSSVNSVGAEVYGATIGGGGALNYFGSAYSNRVEANFGTVSGGLRNTIQTNTDIASPGGTIGGGYLNTIQSNAYNTTIGGGGANTIQTGAHGGTIAGGAINTIQTNAFEATVGGGNGNTIQANARYATIGGGGDNTIQPGADYGIIGGGEVNTVGANADYATIGGGQINTIQTGAYVGTIGGGQVNTIQTNANFATIGGGKQNTIQTFAQYATIPGGYYNSAASYALAAGYRAKANHQGCFVWADSQDADFTSTANNQFNIRASGGVRLSDSTPQLSFGQTTRQMITLYDSGFNSTFGVGVQSSTFYQRCGSGSGFAWFQGGTHNNAQNNSGGGNTLMLLGSGGLTVNGTFVSASDRNGKENFAPVQPRAVLEQVLALPLSSWNYKVDPATRHLGPMAQDFYAAFNVGPDDKHIATVDADGVALAAIQGLNQKLEEQRVANTEMKARLERLEKLIERSTLPNH